MTDAGPETRDRLAGLVDHLTIDVESRLRGARQRPPRPSRQRVVAALVAFAVAAAAIGLAAYAFTHRTEPPRPAAPRGGAITVGSDYPECLNPITGCAAATATWWTVLDHVLAHAMVLDERGNWVASPLLTQAPSLANGGLTENPFTLTYRLNPKATWADGAPITSADFDFTWRAIMNTESSYTTVSYDQIESIDITDPGTVAIRFKDVFADWPDLFGGPFGGILEKAAFPRFANDPKPNLVKEMLHSIPFSGGPWVLKSFGPGGAVLGRNDSYYGPVPHLDQVTFIARYDSELTRKVQSLLAGDIAAAQIYTSDLGVLPQLSGKPDVRAVGGDGFNYEALWFNVESAPLDDAKVREALMYAIDRQSVVETQVKPINPNAQVLNCGFIALAHLGPWCQTRPFEQFIYDPIKAKQILESDGYDCSSPPCRRSGERLVVDFTTVTTNPRRAATMDLLRSKALEAGVEVRVVLYEAGTLFGVTGPHGGFTVSEFSRSGSIPDPSVTANLACESIPTKANGFTGGNWGRWCNREATDLMHQSDRELDPARRLDLMNRIYQLEANDFIGLPLYVVPQITAWRTDEVDGPIDAFSSSPNGPFWNIGDWHLPRRSANS
jgi:peptide/nickel transport system substrate-binding protein